MLSRYSEAYQCAGQLKSTQLQLVRELGGLGGLGDLGVLRELGGLCGLRNPRSLQRSRSLQCTRSPQSPPSSRSTPSSRSPPSAPSPPSSRTLQISKISNTQKHKNKKTQLLKYANTQIHEYTNTRIHKNTNTRVKQEPTSPKRRSTTKRPIAPSNSSESSDSDANFWIDVEAIHYCFTRIHSVLLLPLLQIFVRVLLLFNSIRKCLEMVNTRTRF
ncbi:unnamed protein product [Trichogramma brassicae]|uniref:Uncharacterized protein n=1 Tax=Trichogramma brassicae TaxID=86971 RepID=A0A6H5IE64_9HYME|nr:unnamed protein product [Trichogramma brassicae]